MTPSFYLSRPFLKLGNGIGLILRSLFFLTHPVDMSRYLSLAEVDRGIRDVLGLDEVFDAKRAIFEAFRFAKNSSPVGLSYTESNFLSSTICTTPG